MKQKVMIVDVVYKKNLGPMEVDVEEISKTHYKIYASHPLTNAEKMEAIYKFCGTVLENWEPIHDPKHVN